MALEKSKVVYNEQMRRAHIKAQDDVIRRGGVQDSASEGGVSPEIDEDEDVIEFDEETMKLSPEERDVWFNRNPNVFGELDSIDGEIATDDAPHEQAKDVRVMNGLRYKEDAIGRWYQVDREGRRVIRTRQQRRRVVGVSPEEWTKLSTSKMMHYTLLLSMPVKLEIYHGNPRRRSRNNGGYRIKESNTRR